MSTAISPCDLLANITTAVISPSQSAMDETTSSQKGVFLSIAGGFLVFLILISLLGCALKSRCEGVVEQLGAVEDGKGPIGGAAAAVQGEGEVVV